MNKWKLIIEQVESGYAAYRWRLVYQGVEKQADIHSNERYDSYHGAGEAADRYRKMHVGPVESVPVFRRDAKVTRVEVIDNKAGRLVVRYDVDVTLGYQDDGRTLKIFLRSR